MSVTVKDELVGALRQGDRPNSIFKLDRDKILDDLDKKDVIAHFPRGGHAQGWYVGAGLVSSIAQCAMT